MSEKKKFVPEVIFNNLRFDRNILDTYGQKTTYKLIIGFCLLLISIVSLFYTNSLVAKLKERELRQVKLYAEGLRYALSTGYDEDITIIMEIIQESTSLYGIPAIYVDETNYPTASKNIVLPHNASLKRQEAILRAHVKEMAIEHPPIPVELKDGNMGYVYYSNSLLLTQLSYYPYIQLSGLFIIGFLAYLAFSSARRAEQNRVWVGLAKETAHQLGTPLSSLMAWIEYFRSDPDFDHSIADELEKDVKRLEMITTRFSNIGSEPAMKSEDVYHVVHDFIVYLKKRVSTKVSIQVNNQLPEQTFILMNKNLFEWVIENVCKNAVDAMSGVGSLTLTLQQGSHGQGVIIDIIDSGKGMTKYQAGKIFNPGFSTKKRGWGLGLTLAKRITENYHNGKLFVKHSEVGKGTTFRIILPS